VSLEIVIWSLREQTELSDEVSFKEITQNISFSSEGHNRESEVVNPPPPFFFFLMCAGATYLGSEKLLVGCSDGSQTEDLWGSRELMCYAYFHDSSGHGSTLTPGHF
jgi:hypothetical protein